MVDLIGYKIWNYATLKPGQALRQLDQLLPVLELSTLGCSSTQTQHTAEFT